MLKVYKKDGKIEIKELKRVEIKLNNKKLKLVVSSI